MVINDFNGFRASVRPEKAQAVLVVDADAVLTCPITSQGFQPVAWRDPQVVESVSNLQLPELASGYSLECLEPRHRPSLSQPLGIGTSEGTDHQPSIVLLCGMVVSRACSRLEGRGFKGCGECSGPMAFPSPADTSGHILRKGARTLPKGEIFPDSYRP